MLHISVITPFYSGDIWDQRGQESKMNKATENILTVLFSQLFCQIINPLMKEKWCTVLYTVHTVKLLNKLCEHLLFH